MNPEYENIKNNQKKNELKHLSNSKKKSNERNLVVANEQFY